MAKNPTLECETDLVNNCLALLKRFGFPAWRNNTGALWDRRGRPVRFGLCVGSSDIIGIARGTFLAVECKVGNNQMTPDQEAFLKLVNDKGGVGVCVRSLEELSEVLGRA